MVLERRLLEERHRQRLLPQERLCSHHNIMVPPGGEKGAYAMGGDAMTEESDARGASRGRIRLCKHQ
jgi:hypothetical protein